jgi:uncharacterized protein YoxC
MIDILLALIPISVIIITNSISMKMLKERLDKLENSIELMKNDFEKLVNSGVLKRMNGFLMRNQLK